MSDSADDRITNGLAALVDEYEDGGFGMLYENLAPLYDFIYQYHYDYDAQRDIVTNVAPDNAEAVLEGACGTGRLLTRLEDDFETVIGVDLHEKMLEQAALRTSADLVEADLTTYVHEDSVDVYAILGNAFTHFRGDEEPKRLLTRARESLSGNGVFVADFMRKSQLEDGYTAVESWEDDRFTVEREVTSTLDDDEGRFTMNFEYTITDTARGKTAVIEELIQSRAFSDEFLLDLAEEIGFSEATIWDDLDHDGVLVARV